jgi:hypothetical protein
MKISALIPSFDQVVDAAAVVNLVKKSGVDEIVFSSQRFHDCPTVRPGANRAEDFNNTAQAATGDVFVFIHQNTRTLPKNFVEQIRSKLADPGVVGGGFHIRFDNPHFLLQLNARYSNHVRMRLRKTIYADQTLFIRSSVFRKMGGFKEIPIFEDTEFSHRLRKFGQLAFVSEAVETSAHRFLKHGIFYHSLRNQVLKIMYHIGVPPGTLKRIYERSSSKE